MQSTGFAFFLSFNSSTLSRAPRMHMSVSVVAISLFSVISVFFYSLLHFLILHEKSKAFENLAISYCIRCHVL